MTTWIEVLADIAKAADLLAQVRAEFWRKVAAYLPEVMPEPTAAQERTRVVLWLRGLDINAELGNDLADIVEDGGHWEGE